MASKDAPKVVPAPVAKSANAPAPKSPTAGATEPMAAALAAALTPPELVEPPFNPSVVEPKPHEAARWAEGKLPADWHVMRPEAQQVAREAANAAYADGRSEADAVAIGVVAAKEWARAHSTTVRG